MKTTSFTTLLGVSVAIAMSSLMTPRAGAQSWVIKDNDGTVTRVQLKDAPLPTAAAPVVTPSAGYSFERHTTVTGGRLLTSTINNSAVSVNALPGANCVTIVSTPFCNAPGLGCTSGPLFYNPGWAPTYAAPYTYSQPVPRGYNGIGFQFDQPQRYPVPGTTYAVPVTPFANTGRGYFNPGTATIGVGTIRR